MYLFLVVVGLCCCGGAGASHCGAPLAVEYRLWSTDSVVVVHRAELLRGIWIFLDQA